MKFTIRDLFLVTMIVAILVAWWQDRSRLADENRELRKKRPLFGDVYIDGIEIKALPNSSAPAPNPPKP